MDVNPFLADMLGYSHEDLLGKQLWDIGALADVAASKASFATLQQQESIRYENLPLVTKDGRHIYVEFISNLYTVDKVRVIQCNIRDITDRKRAEEEIKRLNADLAERAADLVSANQELEAFNSMVAHDLRQPLNLISTYSQAIKMLCEDQLKGECADYPEKIHDTTLRMDRLIEALLNFSRMGRIEPRREPVDLCAMANEVAMALKRSEPERQVDFRITDGITANADANLLRMVLDNLLGNAWKYSGKQEKAIIGFGETEIDGLPTYFVCDNGIGFDKADADKLFVPFQRLPGAEERKGFGIGLATVERIVQRHGGKIWAKGESGKGACFYFTLSANTVSI